MKHRRDTLLLVLMVALSACSGSGGGGSSEERKTAFVTIEEPTTASTYETTSRRMGLNGHAFILNELSDHCLDVNCWRFDVSPPAIICRGCSSGVSVSWSNTATGDSGTAASGLVRGDCGFLGFACEVVNRWSALVCLEPGANQVMVTAAGGGLSATDSITVTLNEEQPPALPTVPAGLQALSRPEQVVLSWSPNPSHEDVITYTVYVAETPWNEWDETLPGARRHAEIRGTTFTVLGLTDDVTYWFAVTASTCAGESQSSAQISATPETVATSISLDILQDVMVPGVGRTYTASVTDGLGNSLPGVIVVWSSSEPSVATVSTTSSETNAAGAARIEVLAQSIGETTITATAQGTAVSKSMHIVVAPPLSNIAGIAAGEDHTCAITDSGSAKCWGLNDWRQLGNEGNGSSNCPEPPAPTATPHEHCPVAVAALTEGATAIALGHSHSCAVTSVGGVKCWGRGFSERPVDVVGLTSGVDAIAAGGFHTCALGIAGDVKCWGRNGNGQLGDGTVMNSSIPLDVVGLTSGVHAIAAGYDHTCALTMAGGVKCWGRNIYGELGDGTATGNTETANSIPVDVIGLTSGVSAIAAGYGHTCALKTDGTMKCWGLNFDGQLGNGNYTDSSIPVDVVGLTSGVSAIAAGGFHTCAVDTNGSVTCWGENDEGQLGDGTRGKDRLTPRSVVDFDSGASAITAGARHTCALTITDHVKCWGENVWGQVGDGTSLRRRVAPVDVIAP